MMTKRSAWGYFLRASFFAGLYFLHGCIFQNDVKGGGADTEAFNIRGHVATAAGARAAGALVKLIPADYDPSRPNPKLIETQLTDSLGEFSFNQIPKDSLYNLISTAPGNQVVFAGDIKVDTAGHALTLSAGRVFNVAKLQDSDKVAAGPVGGSAPFPTPADTGILFFPGTDITVQVGESLSTLDTVPKGLGNLGYRLGNNKWRYGVVPNKNGDPLLMDADTLLVEARGSNLILTPQRSWTPLAALPFTPPGAGFTPTVPTSRYHMASGKGLDLYATNDKGLFRTVNQGKTWEAIQDISASAYSALAADSTGLLIINRLLSLDRGDTWREFGKCDSICDTLVATAIGIAPNKTLLAGGSFDKTVMLVNRTDDYGTTNILTHTSQGIQFTPIAFVTSDQGRVYLGTNRAGIMTSGDLGRTWFAQNKPVGDYLPGFVPTGTAAADLTSLVTSKEGVVYAGYLHAPGDTSSPSLYRISSDLMSSASVEGDFHYVGVTCMIRGPSGAIFVGTWGKGVFRSFDGKIWAPFIEGIGSRYVLSMSIDSSETLFVLTREGMLSQVNAEGTDLTGT